MTRRITSILALAWGAGCTHPQTMQYDYARAYQEAFKTQANLSRPLAAGADYALGGAEAAEIRTRNKEASSDEEDVVPETTATFSVE